MAPAAIPAIHETVPSNTFSMIGAEAVNIARSGKGKEVSEIVTHTIRLERNLVNLVMSVAEPMATKTHPTLSKAALPKFTGSDQYPGAASGASKKFAPANSDKKSSVDITIPMSRRIDL